MKKLLLVLGIVILTGAVLAAGFWWFITQPLYEPGALRDEPSLDPFARDEDGIWRVTEDVELSQFASGEGPNVLYVHGGPGIPPSGPIPAFEDLASDYRVHYYAQRGTGESTRPIDRFEGGNAWENIQLLVTSLGIKPQLADIERIRGILGDEKLILVGHSYGGFLAALFAAELPERVEALVLIAPADLLVLPNSRPDLFEAMRARLPETEHPAYDDWLKRYLDLGASFSMSESELAELDTEFARFYEMAAGPLPETARVAEGAPGPWMTRAQFFSMGMRHDYADALAAVTAPTLILHGTDDIQPLAVAEDYRDAIPNARVVVIDGAGHMMHHTHSADVANAIRETIGGGSP